MGPKRGPATASDELCCLTRRQMMEPLWSLVVATSGNRSQILRPKEPQKHAKTFAVGGHRLLFGAHGKEGVEGSSPSEGSAKAPEIGTFSSRSTCVDSNVRWVWSRLWSFQIAKWHFARTQADAERSCALSKSAEARDSEELR